MRWWANGVVIHDVGTEALGRKSTHFPPHRQLGGSPISCVGEGADFTQRNLCKLTPTTCNDQNKQDACAVKKMNVCRCNTIY